METINDNHLNSLKRLKDISRIIEATLQQNNRIKGILANELYFRKKCEASIETIKNNTDEQECYRKVSKM
ncbi:mediator of RNA polymerase II transcription subunit 11 [Plasmodium yoelii yoelii]|uniref:Mediator of RNA polymerase II transcription subunit 11 n=1 Tax=Plasmodium yoelii yoelii TaxID=73239 RepID=A0AAE9WR73_PLAYO|nr:mediator of RNA polymerase II transcription subunit 11 [Plasmodium yoelii yoelii]